MPSRLRFAGLMLALLSGCATSQPRFSAKPVDRGRVLYVVSDQPTKPPNVPQAPATPPPPAPVLQLVPPTATPEPQAAVIPPAEPIAPPDTDARVKALTTQVQQFQQQLAAQQQQPPPVQPPSAAYLTHMLLAEKDLRLKDVQLETARQQAMAAYQVLAARGHAVPGPVIADFGKAPTPGAVTNLFAPPAAGCRTCIPHNLSGSPTSPGGNRTPGEADPNAGVVKLY